jgi:hypothetical protein
MSATTKAPSAWAIERAFAVLAETRDRLLADDAALPEDQKLWADLLDGESEGDPFAVLDRLHDSTRHDEDMAQMANVRATELSERKARFTRRSERTRAIMFQMLEALQITALERATYSATIGKGQPELIIDEAELPDEHMRITKSPDRKAIRKLLVDGTEVRGAILGNAAARLTLRTR